VQVVHSDDVIVEGRNMKRTLYAVKAVLFIAPALVEMYCCAWAASAAKETPEAETEADELVDVADRAQ